MSERDASRHEPGKNPWRLSDCEAEMMDALIQAGNYKAVARITGHTEKGVEAQMFRVARKMPGRTRLKRILEWDRWRQSQKQQEQTR